MNSDCNGFSYKTLPKGWRWAKLGDVAEQDKTTLKPNDELCSRLPYISLEHVDTETGRINGFGKSNILSNTFIFDERHVLYGKLRPYLNKVATPDFRGRCTTEIIPLNPEGITREYLAHFLRLPETVEYAMMGKTGSRMPRTDMRAFMHLPIPLPPLAEQQRIVRILDEKLAAIERAKRMAEVQVEAANAMSSAYLREIIPSDRDTLPQGWRWVKLGEICKLVRGVTYKRTEEVDHGGHQVLRANNISVKSSTIELSDIKLVSDHLEFPDEKKLVNGDIFICLASGSKDHIGKVAYVSENTNYYIGGFMGSIRVNLSNILARFLFLQLHHGWFNQFLRLQISSTNINNLSAKLLYQFEIPLPPPASQERIVRILDEKLATIEDAKRAAEAQLEMINAMPAAYSREAFAGELS